MSQFEKLDVTNAKPFYATFNAIVGNGEVPAIPCKDGMLWALPGGGTTTSIAEAYRVATELDRLITANLQRSGRKIMRHIAETRFGG